MASQVRACGFVIFRRLYGNVEYLLMQTSYGENHWTPPKGHVDPGESDMQAALRETEEEAGFVSTDLRIFEEAKQVLSYSVQKRPKTVIYWLAELVNSEKSVRLSKEHQDFKWLSLDEACSYAKYSEMQTALRSFDKYIQESVIH